MGVQFKGHTIQQPSDKAIVYLSNLLGSDYQDASKAIQAIAAQHGREATIQAKRVCHPDSRPGDLDRLLALVRS